MGLAMPFRLSKRLSGICALLLAAMPVAASAGTTANAYLEATLQMDPPNAARELCARYDWACTDRRAGAGPSKAEQLALIAMVNREVNRAVRAVSDRQQYGRTDHWSLPTTAGGDCEDYALLKKKELIRHGLDPKTLLLATVLDRRRIPHAVLIYRSSKGDVLLDNLTDDVIDWRASAYIFLRMQNPEDPRRWVGGFRPR